MSARKQQNNRKSGATRNEEQGSSAVKRFLVIILTILFAVFLVYLDNIPVQEKGSKAKNNTSKEKVEKKPENKKEKYKFVFYDELPDRKVETYTIEEEPIVKSPITQKKVITSNTAPVEKANIKTVKATKPVSKTQSNMLYQLQVGAFSEWAKADAMKGRLALLGIEPNIQVFHANGQKMYRVRIGPSSNEIKMERIKSQLKAQNINTFIQKIKL